jgi:hypothetical protein
MDHENIIGLLDVFTGATSLADFKDLWVVGHHVCSSCVHCAKMIAKLSTMKALYSSHHGTAAFWLDQDDGWNRQISFYHTEKKLEPVRMPAVDRCSPTTEFWLRLQSFHYNNALQHYTHTYVVYTHMLCVYTCVCMHVCKYNNVTVLNSIISMEGIVYAYCTCTYICVYTVHMYVHCTCICLYAWVCTSMYLCVLVFHVVTS